MKAYKEQNNLEEIDFLIHEKVYDFRNFQGFVPKYSSDLSLAMSAAEKVGLFSTTMLSKEGEVWLVLRKQKDLYTLKTESDWDAAVEHGQFYGTLTPISMGHSPSEVIARACLVLKVKENEQSSRTDQQSLGIL